MEKPPYHSLWPILLGLALLFSGCASQSPLIFGMYSVPLQNLAEARSLGMDFVVGPKEAKYLQAAKRAGLKVIGQGPQSSAESVVIGNYLTDEPDLFDVPPWKIEKEFKIAKRRSSKPVFLNLSTAYSFESYAAFCDVAMFDWYPVGWRPIETYYANLRIARLAAGKKPFFATIQTFDWSHYPKLMPPSSRHRPPSPEELKAMTVWAAMNGAAGITFYPFDDGNSRIMESPALVAAIRDSIQLIRENELYFSPQRAWAPYPFSFPNSADSANSISETSIAVRFSVNPENRHELLVVAANTTTRTLKVKAIAMMPIINSGPELVFAPFEVKLLRITTPPSLQTNP